MSIKSKFIEAYKQVKVNKKILITLIIMFLYISLTPDLSFYQQKDKYTDIYVYTIEYGLRFVNTVAQIIIPILLVDKIGIVQAFYVGSATLVSTITLKIIFNNIHMDGINLGERPSTNRYNMPSGHTTMAASAMAFVAIRYGAINLIYLLPITILTMVVRVLLKAHTLTAVLSGLILGIIIAMLFSARYKGDFKWEYLIKKARNFILHTNFFIRECEEKKNK